MSIVKSVPVSFDTYFFMTRCCDRYIFNLFFGLWLICYVGIQSWNLSANAEEGVPQTLSCDVLTIGGGLSGVAASYEALLLGKTVCLTEITDWIGGQATSQGTSALDETVGQRQARAFPKGYLQFRDRIIQKTGRSRPGDCWVSLVCFNPQLGHDILFSMIQGAAKTGKGTLHWLPNTVIKHLDTQQVQNSDLITQAIAIQHHPQPRTLPLNTEPLSATLADSYNPKDSARFKKQQIYLRPPTDQDWIVIEATETGEILALADVPYRVGVDPRSHKNPSAPHQAHPYCTQALTYTFAMEATANPQQHQRPDFYDQYEPFYSFDKPNYASNPNLVFSYRRIYSQVEGTDDRTIVPGDISMQNWGGGNDYGPGNSNDNIILTQEQLRNSGQLAENGWMGGLRTDSLRRAEEAALGFFYWWTTGDTDSKVPNIKKQPISSLRLLTGLDSPMGTAHGLSKYPYIRESRRLIGRNDFTNPNGFEISEIDVTRKNFREDYYRNNLSSQEYRDLITAMSGLKTLDVITDQVAINDVDLRARSRLFPDSVGIGHYPIDFHPCMLQSPPEKAGNIERPGERQGASRTFPYQIPLRAMIPQRIDNLIVTGKSIAASHISAATYRTHSYEWSAGAAAGTTAAFVLDKNIKPYQLIENMPRYNPELAKLQHQLNQNGNPTHFEGMSIVNEDWEGW